MQVVKKTDTQRWYRGYGTDQYVYYAQKGPKKFLGGTFEVESYAELEKYVKPANATAIPCFILHSRPLRYSSSRLTPSAGSASFQKRNVSATGLKK